MNRRGDMPSRDVSARSPGLRTALVLAALAVALTGAVNVRTLGNGFTNWDDQVYVLENPLVRRFDAAGLAAIFTTAWEGNYQPLLLATYALEWRLFGADPRPYHVSNYLLHLANTALVFVLCRQFLGTPAAAFAVSLAFGVHPFNVEPVAWISGRKELLMAFFFLGSLLLYVRYVTRRSTASLALSLVLFAAAGLSKGTAMTLPAVLFLADRLVQPDAPVRWNDKIPYFAGGGLLAVAALSSQSSAGTLNFAVYARYGWKTILLCLDSLWTYAAKTFLPTGYSAYYPYPPVSEAASVPVVLGAFAGLAILLAAILLWARKAPLGPMLLLFVLPLVPVLKFLPLGNVVAADRYMYMPLLGLLLATVHSGRQAFGWNRAAPALLGIVFAAWVFVLSGATWQRIGVWKDSVSLWSDVVGKYPRDFLARFNLGTGFLEAGEPERAVAALTDALRFRPDRQEGGRTVGDPYIHFYRGLALKQSGRTALAAADFGIAMESDPGYYPPCLELALLYAGNGEADRALRLLAEGLRRSPGNPLIREQIARLSRSGPRRGTAAGKAGGNGAE